MCHLTCYNPPLLYEYIEEIFYSSTSMLWRVLIDHTYKLRLFIKSLYPTSFYHLPHFNFLHQVTENTDNILNMQWDDISETEDAMLHHIRSLVNERDEYSLVGVIVKKRVNDLAKSINNQAF